MYLLSILTILVFEFSIEIPVSRYFGLKYCFLINVWMMSDRKSGEINYWTDLAQTLAHNVLYIKGQNRRTRSYVKPVKKIFLFRL